MRIIAHIDMDAFFASVEERDKEWLKGLPIVIGSDPQDGKGRGVVSTANYKAREYGIRSAVPISIAWRLSEEAAKQGKQRATFITPNMDKYSQVSARIMAIVAPYTEHIEEASIDEAYFDLSHLGSFEKATKVAKQIQAKIVRQESLTASVGIGPNKLVAKIASDFKKPNGLTVVREAEVEAFLQQIGLRKIPGIGPKMEEMLREQNITTTADLYALEPIDLELMFGRSGLDLYDKVRGIDDTPIVEEWIAQSIGEQETLQQDTLDGGIILELLKKLSGQVYGRFTESGFETFKTVGITVRFEGFETKTRIKTLSAPTGDNAVLEFEALKLLLPFLDIRENPKRKSIRLIGVKIEKLQ
jgi:DNA polymerase IV (DinB-like DNA polymerase)